MRPAVKQLIKGTLKSLGLEIRRYRRDTEPATMWAQAEDFQLLLKQIDGHTLVTGDRCFMLYQLARYAKGMYGDMAEVGVYKGGTAKLIAAACPDKLVHLFDTFSGMPQDDPSVDRHRRGDFSDASLESVEEFLRDCHNVVFHPGLFPQSAHAIKDSTFCFVHVDGDLYQTVKDCLEFFYHRMVPGGVMVCDDYDWKGCPGVKRAISEFLARGDDIPIITARYQCMLLKP